MTLKSLISFRGDEPRRGATGTLPPISLYSAEVNHRSGSVVRIEKFMLA